jgi:hypothetical protein
MRRLVDDGCRDDLRSGVFRQDVPWVQLAGAKSLAVAPESAWQHNNQHAFKIAAQPVVAKAIICPDETEGRLDTAEGNLSPIPARAGSNP